LEKVFSAVLIAVGVYLISVSSRKAKRKAQQTKN
jgi:prolipoprotein diacylglyceryltransferase